MSDWLDAETHADRALEMFERGRWAEAEVELRKALSLNPDQAEWHYNLGLTLEAAGRDLEALSSYERSIELMPDQAEPLLAAGVVCNRLQRHGHAIQWLNRALSVAPGNETAHAHRIAALVRLGDHEEAETAFYLAQHAMDDPSAHCYAAIAESLIERGVWKRAEWCLKEALRLEPHAPRLRARLAAVLAATGKPQRALQMYLRDVRDDPGNIDTLLDYGELLIDLGRLPDAAEKFRRVLELEPANVDAHYRLGQIALNTGRLEQAHLEFELVMKLEPTFPSIRLAVAEVQMKRGRQDAARHLLRDELAEWQQDDPPAERSGDDLERFGTLLLEAGLPAEAAMLFERAARHDRDNLMLLRKLANARFRSGQMAGGVAASRRVLRLDPTCTASIHNLALAAIESGQIRVAAGWIGRGLRVNRHDDGLRRLRMRLWMMWLRRSARAVRGLGRPAAD
jgi:tetratricopeptide (TPR) repeat protein